MSKNLSQLIKAHVQEEFLFDRPDFIITDSTPLIDEGIIDSLGIFVMINFFQEQLGVEVAADEVVLDNFESVEAMVELIQSKQAGESGNL